MTIDPEHQDAAQVIRHFGSVQEPFGEIPEGAWQSLRPRWKQVHGTSTGEVRHPGQELGEVDAVWTRVPELPIGVVTADCVPILLERADGKAVAAIHAGWRGTHARILAAFFRSLPPDLSDPREWVARLGPSVRACCYAVGEDLLERFARDFPEMPRPRWEPKPGHLDLIALNSAELLRLGARIAFVHPDCTLCAIRDGVHMYSSYRRGDRESRQISMICLSSKKYL
jgi:YfiH family protein